MSFQSLNHLLDGLEHRYRLQDARQFQRLQACWAAIVGPAVAVQTRPLSIRKGVLRVATASSVWAQTLTFERSRILTKLNAQLPESLTDIQFSTARWHDTTSATSEGTEDWEATYQNHPSRLPEAPESPTTAAADRDPQEQFARWAIRIQTATRHLPLCPSCHCPTPQGELERWQQCALCAAQAWHPLAPIPHG